MVIESESESEREREREREREGEERMRGKKSEGGWFCLQREEGESKTYTSIMAEEKMSKIASTALLPESRVQVEEKCDNERVAFSIPSVSHARKRRRLRGSLLEYNAFADSSNSSSSNINDALVSLPTSIPIQTSRAGEVKESVKIIPLIRPGSDESGRSINAPLLASKNRKNKNRNGLATRTIPPSKGSKNEDLQFAEDVQERPDAPKQDAYARVAVKDFGEALLRGMGWAPGTGVGKTKVDVKPLVLGCRPTLLGLGAAPKPGSAIIGSERSAGRDPSTRQGKWLCSGELVVVKEGTHEGEYAVVRRVAGVPGLNNIEVCCMTDSSAHASFVAPTLITRDAVRRVDANALGPHHAAVHFLQEIEKLGKMASSSIPPSRTSKDAESAPKTCENTTTKRSRHLECWLLPGIRVRIVSKTYAGGKYYSQKAVVRAVSDVAKRRGIVQLNDGRIEDRMRQSKLETALPKPGGQIVIVRGAKRGARGKLLHRDGRANVARVQLFSSAEIESLPFDDVAEYVFNSDAEFVL